MPTGRDEYERLLEAYADAQQAAEQGITREYAAEEIGRSIYHDLSVLASSPAHSNRIYDFFSTLHGKETIALRDIVDELMKHAANVSLQTAEHIPAERIYGIHQGLSDLFDKTVKLPSEGYVNRNLLDRLGMYLNELRELQNRNALEKRQLNTYYKHRQLENMIETGRATPKEVEVEKRLRQNLVRGGVLEKIKTMEDDFITITAKYSDLNNMFNIYTLADDPIRQIYDVEHKLSDIKAGLTKELTIFNSAISAALEESGLTVSSYGTRGLETVYKGKSLSEVRRTVDRAKELRAKALRNIAKTTKKLKVDMSMFYGTEEAFEDVLGGRALTLVRKSKGDRKVELFAGGRPTGIKGAEAEQLMRAYQRQIKRYRSVLKATEKYKMPEIPRVLHGDVTGDPRQVKASIELARGVDSLRQHVTRKGVREAEETVETVEAIAAWRDKAGGMEAMRGAIGKHYSEGIDQSYRVYKFGQEPVPKEHRVADHTPEWQTAMAEKERYPIHVPGSAVPYEVVTVTPERKVATIKPMSIRAEDISATIRLAPGVSAGEFERILRGSQEASRLAKEIKHTIGTDKLEKLFERTASVIAGSVQVADINRIISGAAGTGRELSEVLYDIAIAHAPWASKQIEKEELANMSMLAMYKAAGAYPGDIAVTEEGFSANTLQEILKHERAKRVYERSLLDEIFGEIKSSGAFNSIASLTDYIKENLRIIESPEMQHKLTDLETVRLLKAAAKKVLSDEAGNATSAMHHLKHISDMSTAEILGEMVESARQNPKETITVRLDKVANKLRSKDMLTEDLIGNKEAVAQFLMENKDLIADLKKSRDINESKRIIEKLTESFTNQTGLDKMTLLKTLKIKPQGKFAPDMEYNVELAGLGENNALRRIKDLLALRRELGGVLEIDFFAGEDKQPITIAQGTHDIIATNQLTNRRYIVGPVVAVTETTATEPVSLAGYFEKYENRIFKEIRGVPADELPIVRQPGVNFRSLITLSEGGGGIYLEDIPDISLSALHKLRKIRSGSSKTLIGFDWETTALPGGSLPFYPTEVGFVAEKLRKEPGGVFSRENLAEESILFKPSTEVVEALERVTGEIEEAIAKGSVAIEEEKFHFMRNIAKFADNEILRRTAGKAVGGYVKLDGQAARQLIEAARGGVKYLGEHGVELGEGLARLTELMKEARKTTRSRPILFGQNMLRAEYEWSKMFAGMAQDLKVRAKFEKEVEKLFDMPRAELIILDKLVLAGQRGPSTIEAQVERYVKPILQADDAAPVKTANIIRELGVTGEAAHRGLEDIKTELAVLYSHVGRELPATTDLRPIPVGGYAARHKVSRAGGAFASAEEGRPVRDVFKYGGIIKDKDRYKIALSRVEFDSGGKPVEIGAVEFIHAPSMLELARRFHEQYEYLPSEEAARQMYNEFVEDYARREVLKAVRQPKKLGEVVTWLEQGLPVSKLGSGDFESSPAVILSREYARVGDKLESGVALTPAEELLFGAGYKPPRDTSAYSQPTLGSEEFIKQELSGTKAGRMRRRAWPQVKNWLESPEGQAYVRIIDDARRYQAIGVLEAPIGEVLKQVEETRSKFITSHGLEPVMIPRHGMYSLGIPKIPDIEPQEIVITASSPERIERRIRRFMDRAARESGKRIEDIFAGLTRHLEQSGIAQTGAAISPTALSTILYQAAREEKLPAAMAEARHIPVINTPELAEEFVEAARREALLPNLSVVRDEETGRITTEEVEKRIAEHPVLRARAEKYQQAMAELEDRGLAGLHRHPAVKTFTLTAGLPGEELIFDSTGLKSPDLVKQLYDKVRQVRAGTRDRVRISSLRYRHGLDDLINTLSGRLRSEIYAASPQPWGAWEALGWPSPGSSGGNVITKDAIIPVPGPPELKQDIFMRRLGEFSPDELKEIANVLQDENSAVARRTGRMIEQYLWQQNQQPKLQQAPTSTTPTSAAPVTDIVSTDAVETRGAAAAESTAPSTTDTSTSSNAVRDMNEAIKEEAARRRAAGGEGEGPVKNLNEAIKEEAARRQILRQAEAGEGIGRRTLKTDLEAIGRGLARNWKLIAGLGATGLGLSIVLKPRDRDEITSEDSRAYTSSKKGAALKPAAEEAYPKARAIPVEEKGSGGLRIRVRGRRRGGIDYDTVSNAIGATVNDTLGINTNINISTQDNRRAINEQSVKDMFSKLLKYGYIS